MRRLLAHLLPHPELIRSPENGFRCVRYLSNKISPTVLKCIPLASCHDFQKEKPVPDEVFQAYKRQFAYDMLRRAR
jgi:hypothetical protein